MCPEKVCCISKKNTENCPKLSIYTKARKYVNTTDLGVSRLAGEVLQRTRPNAICIPNLVNANVYNVSST